MKVLKFGGASVKDADGIRNLAQILEKFRDEPVVIVLSAMGKSTNALEEILRLYVNGDDFQTKLNELKEYHKHVVHDLFEEPATILEIVEELFMDMECRLEREPTASFDYLYDQLIPLGELLSTKIVHYFLQLNGYKNRWIDARNFVITHPIPREARLNWEITVPLIEKKIKQMATKSPVITQGFIGSTKENVTTTLGREGSDFTAAIFAYALDADEVIVWKDVPGILNADPAKFDDTVKFDELSYQEAIEMTYYGASVIHPKTIKPLQNKNIPLKVKSFIHPEDQGTIIHQTASGKSGAPVIIIKENQVLFQLSTKDYSFIAEDNLSRIFEAMAKSRIKANMMQNSAISFAFCTDFMQSKFDLFLENLNDEFQVSTVKDLQLLTLRPFDQKIAGKQLENRTIYLEQRNGNTVQYVTD